MNQTVEEILKQKEKHTAIFNEVIKKYETTFNTRAKCSECGSLEVELWVKTNKGLNKEDWIFACEEHVNN